MLSKIKNQENIILVSFVVALLCVCIYGYRDRCIMDGLYLVALMYYFIRFLIVRTRR